jgi:hypothetical protein
MISVVSLAGTTASIDEFFLSSEVGKPKYDTSKEQFFARIAQAFCLTQAKFLGNFTLSCLII